MKKLLSIVLTGMMILSGMMSSVFAKTPYQIFFGKSAYYSQCQAYKKIGNTAFHVNKGVTSYQYKGNKKKTLKILKGSHIVSNGETAFYFQESNRNVYNATAYVVMKINLKNGKTTKVDQGEMYSFSYLFGYMEGKLIIADESMESNADFYRLVDLKTKNKEASATDDRQDVLDQYGDTYIARPNPNSFDETSAITCCEFKGKKGKKLFTVTKKAYKNLATIANGKLYYFEKSGSKMLLQHVNLNGKGRKTVKKLAKNIKLVYFSDRYVMIKQKGKSVKVKY